MNSRNVDALKSNKSAYEKFLLQKELIEARDWVCCANCDKCSLTGFCKENNLPIPPQVAVTGCANWDGLPF